MSGCDKKPYDSAGQALRAAKRLGRKWGKKRQRAYFCKMCRAYHLTTQDFIKYKDY